MVTKQTKALVADKDIPVYKVLTIKDGYYETPYIHTRVDNLALPFVAHMFKDTFNKEKEYLSCGIHSFTDHKAALSMQLWYPDTRVILDAYIPKGTKYYEGIHDDICSERIIFV